MTTLTRSQQAIDYITQRTKELGPNPQEWEFLFDRAICEAILCGFIEYDPATDQVTLTNAGRLSMPAQGNA